MLKETPEKTPINDVPTDVITQLLETKIVCYVEDYPVLCYIEEDDEGYAFFCHVTDECIENVTHVLLMKV